ncbi:MAG: serine hydrolase domain-containing protein [Candidatus Cybelea sp.]
MIRFRACGFALLASLAGLVVACTQQNGLETASSVTPYAGGRNAPKAITISGIGRDRGLDRLVTAFMLQNGVPNAELAVQRNGHVSFSHAYTNNGLAESVTKQSTIIRLASLSKAWTSAALYNLIATHKLERNWRVFHYLGIIKPLPVGAHVDRRVFDITIEDMIAHESGWDDTISHWDPTFRMRQITLALGLRRPIDQIEEVRYQLHEPLQEKPGTTYAYCNFCYTVLGMVVAKASGMSYQKYLAKVLEPELAVNNVFISPTVGDRLPGEVAKYYNPYRGRSALYITSHRKYPYPYSGDSMLDEVVEGAGGLATNADSMLALMKRYIIWGVGTPPPVGYSAAREGEMPGANTFAAQLSNGVDYAFLVNTNSYAYGSNPYTFSNLQLEIGTALQEK